MKLRAVFDDGSYIEGNRSFFYRFQETPGTHHLKVYRTFGIKNVEISLDDEIVAIPISKPKYWLIIK
jgi:hypothetical protein